MTKNDLKGFERKLLDIDILKVGHHKEKFLWNGRTFLVLYAYIGILDVWSLWCKNEGFQFKGIKIKILKNIQGITIQKRKRNYFFFFHKRLMVLAPTHCPWFMPHWWFPACSFQALWSRNWQSSGLWLCQYSATQLTSPPNFTRNSTP